MATQMVNEETIQDIMDAVHDTLRDHSVEVDDFESIENDIETALKSKLRQAGVYRNEAVAKFKPLLLEGISTIAGRINRR